MDDLDKIGGNVMAWLAEKELNSHTVVEEQCPHCNTFMEYDCGKWWCDMCDKQFTDRLEEIENTEDEEETCEK